MEVFDFEDLRLAYRIMDSGYCEYGKYVKIAFKELIKAEVKDWMIVRTNTKGTWGITYKDQKVCTVNYNDEIIRWYCDLTDDDKGLIITMLEAEDFEEVKQ